MSRTFNFNKKKAKDTLYYNGASKQKDLRTSRSAKNSEENKHHKDVKNQEKNVSNPKCFYLIIHVSILLFVCLFFFSLHL
jgi:hypothetical protein